jgi:hypothetical protein
MYHNSIHRVIYDTSLISTISDNDQIFVFQIEKNTEEGSENKILFSPIKLKTSEKQTSFFYGELYKVIDITNPIVVAMKENMKSKDLYELIFVHIQRLVNQIIKDI